MSNELEVIGNNLKDKLDNIDQQVFINYGNKYGQGMAGIYIGQWYKGREVESGLKGEGGQPNYLKLERQTGRERHNLKLWHDLYKTYKDLEAFKEEYVKLKTEKHIRTWLKGMNATALPEVEKILLPEEWIAPKITQSDYKDWLLQQQQCDMLFTDPPYSTDVDDIDIFSNDWLPMALNKVKSTGRAYIFIGAYPKELKAYLNVKIPKHLTLENILVWTYKNTLGVKPNYNYIQNYQAILYFKGVDAPKLNSPLLMEQISIFEEIHPARSKNRYFSWQKPDRLAEMFIRHATNKGDIILDPFVGSGSLLLAAGRLGRKGFGCDINQQTLDIAKQRGCEY